MCIIHTCVYDTDLHHITHHLVSLEVSNSRGHLQLISDVVRFVQEEVVIVTSQFVRSCVLEDVFYRSLKVPLGQSASVCVYVCVCV